MAASMTGYGRGEVVDKDWAIVWEVKSVNGRYLDAKWRMPSSLKSLERKFEKILRNCASRGRVDLSLNLELTSSELLGVKLNMPQVQAMIGQMRELAADLGQEFTPDLNRIMTASWLWRDADSKTNPALAEALKTGLAQAVKDWDKSRRVEGQAMADDLLKRISTLDKVAIQIGERIPLVLEEKKATLVERFNEIMTASDVDVTEERKLQEIMVLTDKLDVSEELTRLAEHLKRLREVLGRKGEIGKRLDFLCQETFREISTCGNKAQNADISGLVVEFKAELEKCREQVQNIE